MKALPPPSPPYSPLSQTGSALVITLMILALISIMAISFSDIIRSEVSVSAPHEERSQAELYARMGVDKATDTLLAQTFQPTKYWTSQPGAITSAESGIYDTFTQYPLHSGVPTSYNPTATPTWSDPAELNIITFLSRQAMIFPAAAPNDPPPAMPLRWIYVRKDGSFETTATPTTSNTVNPLIGRFAYWTDDQSTRLNLNTAWKRLATTSLHNPLQANHPSTLSLTALPGFSEAMADQLRQAITPLTDYSDTAANIHLINAPEEVKRLDRQLPNDAFGTALATHLAEITTRSTSPHLSPFNEPKIVLSTQVRHAPRDAAGNILLDSNGVPYFLDILTDSTAEPHISNVNFTKLGKVMNKLVTLLQRTDWPFTTQAASFHEKYFNNNVATSQFALDIIDYVRSAESTQLFVEPIRGRYEISGGTGTFTANSVHADSVRGTTRKLFITEMGASRKPIRETVQPHLGRYQVRVMYEIHLPEHFGIPSIDLTNIDGQRLYVLMTDLWHAATSGNNRFMDENGTIIPPGSIIRIDPTDIDGPTTLQAGGYVKVGFTFYLNDLPYPQTIRGRTALIVMNDITGRKYTPDQHGARMEIAPVWDKGVTFDMSISTTPENDPTFATFQVSDPLLNGILPAWVLKPGAPQSWGAPTHPNFPDPTSNVGQDVDEQGNLTRISTRMPSPKGSTDNPLGIVYSVGELGYLRTGLQANANLSTPSVRFRTLRLQPEEDDKKLPDWALLELFTPPLIQSTTAQKLIRPDPVSIAGRINLNQRILPFGLDDNERLANTEQLTRHHPLRAVLLNAKKNAAGERLTTAEVNLLLSRLLNKQLAENAALFGTAENYRLASAIAQIEGLSDKGEEGEFLFRSLIDHLTVRSNTFMVYTIGQSLKQTPSGKIVITAQQRMKAGIERYYDDQITPRLRQTSLEFLTP